MAKACPVRVIGEFRINPGSNLISRGTGQADVWFDRPPRVGRVNP